MSEYQNNLMRNQCMEQCAIYSFLPVGPTYDGLFGYSWIQCLEGKLPGGPSGGGGTRYSVMRIFVGGWFRVVGWEGCATHPGCLV